MADDATRMWLRAMRRAGATWQDVVAAVLEEATPPGDGTDPLLALAQAVSDEGVRRENVGRARCPECHHPDHWHVGHPMSARRRCAPPALVVEQTRHGTFRMRQRTDERTMRCSCTISDSDREVERRRERARATGHITPRRQVGSRGDLRTSTNISAEEMR